MKPLKGKKVVSVEHMTSRCGMWVWSVGTCLVFVLMGQDVRPHHHPVLPQICDVHPNTSHCLNHAQMRMDHLSRLFGAVYLDLVKTRFCQISSWQETTLCLAGSDISSCLKEHLFLSKCDIHKFQLFELDDVNGKISQPRSK